MTAEAPQQSTFDRAVRAIYHRLFEWTMIGCMLGMAVHLTIWPDAIVWSSFRLILNYVAEGWMPVFFYAIGFLRVGALMVNGRWPEYGPKLRGASAAAAAFIWGEMAVALFEHSIDHQIPPSPGIPIYVALALAELFVTYKAAADVRVVR